MVSLPCFKRIALAPSLAAVSAAVMLLLTLVTLQVVGQTMAKQVKQEIGQNLAELSFQTTDKLDRGMYERYREVQLMAERYEITSADVPTTAKRAVLERMQQTHPYYAWIGITDNDGQVKIATGALLEGKDVSGRPWFTAARRGVHLLDVHEAVLLAKLLPNPTGEPKRFFDVAFPYRDAKGQMLGVLGTHLSWQWAANVQRSVLRPLAERKAVDTLILSKGGAVLMGPPEYTDKVLQPKSFQLARRGMNGAVIEVWPDGKRYLVGYSKSRGHQSYPGLEWTVLVRQPLDKAFEPVDALRDKILWGGTGAAALVSLLVWLLSRGIANPLERITRHAGELTTGQLDRIPPVRSRLAEVQILQDALNELLAKVQAKEAGLRELNATLENRVTERTAALHSAVEDTRKSEHRVRAIIDTALDAFVGVDAEGRITDWNPRAEEIFGRPRAEVLGKTVTETIIPPRFREAHQNGMRRFGAKGSSGVVGKRLQLSALRGNGEEFPVEMTIGLINAGDTHFFGTFIQDISQRKEIEDALARERELLDVVLDSIDVGVVVCSSGGEVTMFNRAAREIHGLPPAPLPPEQWADHYRLFLGDGQTPMVTGQVPLFRALHGEQVENAEVVVRPTNGAPRFLFASGRALHAQDGTGIGAVIALKDVTVLKESARRLEASERSLRTITNNLPVLIGYVDRMERYTFANATYEAWFGVQAGGISGKTVREVMGDELYSEHRDKLRGGSDNVTFEMTIGQGDRARTVEVTRIPDVHDGVCNGVYVLGTDISAARRHEEELSRLARVDILTGLPNRRSYHEYLDAAVQRARRSGDGMALMFLDVDHFKQVNDTLGHAAGDIVLQEFARRVKGAVRVTDTVCRLAGDEFTVIVEGLACAAEAALVAQKIVAAFNAPFDLAAGSRKVSASVGVAFTSKFPVGLTELGETADRALYAAKAQGRGCFMVADMQDNN
ncbi:diguanylate cyclase [Massilia sp. METH4]|uniref:sensor domain-containing diguanylate cyclase n=1 Tax=Massilia sp. METH4 TaxID=3123041 RepID=UPI0030D51CFA